jgi:hypothetical protein
MKTPEQAWTEAKGGINLAWLADELKIRRQAVHAWKRVPAQRMLDVSRALGVPCERLRPDLYTPPPPPGPWSALEPKD